MIDLDGLYENLKKGKMEKSYILVGLDELLIKEGIENIIDGLGGKENINTVENCITRLRVNVKDESKINEDIINLTPNSGIVRKGKDIQIIFGLHVHEVRRAVEDFLEAY